jgi:hypothetical protein
MNVLFVTDVTTSMPMFSKMKDLSVWDVGTILVSRYAN